jgi:hypothetical protein
MSKTETLEKALMGRRADPRALRGAITFAGGKPQLTFGVVGDHRRFSVTVNGNKLELNDDPRVDPADEAAETQPETGADGKSGTDAADNK